MNTKAVVPGQRGEDPRFLLVFVTGLLVFVADFVTKWVAVRELAMAPGLDGGLLAFMFPSGDYGRELLESHVRRVPVIPGLFDWFLQYNQGGAFSLLNDYPLVITIVSVAAIVWIYLWSRRISPEHYHVHIVFGLILGGALGNLADRLRFRHVVDFIHFYHHDWYWPTFNVADMAICCGIAVFVYLSLFTKSLDSAAPPGVAESPKASSDGGDKPVSEYAITENVE
ncbi:MAG: signal peptidase II [bacterium]